MANDGGGVLVFLIFVFYFAPAFIAGMRQHPSGWAIAATNLLLGWTLLGWVGALIWSLTATGREKS